MEEEDKKASQFLAMHAKLHPPDGVDEIHPRAGAPVCERWTGGSLLCRSGEFGSQKQHCSRLHSLTLTDAAFSYCRRIGGRAKTALKLNLLFFFFLVLGVSVISD